LWPQHASLTARKNRQRDCTNNDNDNDNDDDDDDDDEQRFQHEGFLSKALRLSHKCHRIHRAKVKRFADPLSRLALHALEVHGRRATTELFRG
jgi:hypothetical protein